MPTSVTQRCPACSQSSFSSHGRLELAEQDHLVLGVELAQQVHRHANLHRFQVTRTARVARRPVGPRDAARRIAGRSSVRGLPSTAAACPEAGQHIYTARHPVTQLARRLLAELRLPANGRRTLFSGSCPMVGLRRALRGVLRFQC